MASARILGTGIDLVESRRMQEVIERWGARFKDKVFLPDEQNYCDAKAFPCHHYAARFAAKEAVSKAFGTGISLHINWLDMEVERDPESGAPSIRLIGKGLELARHHHAGQILVSLSHTHDYAVASAIVVADDSTH
ncbi:MAG: holo-ACP synthase [Verrucomicrobiota bacterium]|nr:holo-ACP synthase [Verrucomicrobiota bacterium]